MLNENIKAIRKSKGLSQQELAIKQNVVSQTISKWKQGFGIFAGIMAIILISAFVIYKWSFPSEYVLTEDEIQLRIQLNTQEDIGLLVYDYLADGREYSGGISNADKSMLKHDDPSIITIWNRQQLNSSSDTVELSMRFRIITEYVDPNYENIYPEEITRYIEKPVSWTANYGGSYLITITGDKENGYTATLD